MNFVAIFVISLCHRDISLGLRVDVVGGRRETALCPHNTYTTQHDVAANVADDDHDDNDDEFVSKVSK